MDNVETAKKKIMSAKTDRNALIDFMLLSAENNSISIEECKNKLEPKKKDSAD